MKRNHRSRKSLFHTVCTYRSFLIIAITLLLIGSVAYSTCKNSQNSRNVSAISDDAYLMELTQVKTTNTPDGQMLNYPGFNVFFSNNHRQPYYSTWILTAQHAQDKTFPRSDKFRPDPNVKNSAQLSDYRRSGYDRGHMAPSADFRYSREAQDATFFLTNMSPQHNSLNGRAWANLEDQCRNWAIRDGSIVIVTGPILSDKLSETIGENKITVPARFFKVVLAPYADPPRAIGFIMPNQYVTGGVQATVTTVDEVEQITGFDFFSALPDDIEEVVESTSKYSVWQHSVKKK